MTGGATTARATARARPQEEGQARQSHNSGLTAGKRIRCKAGDCARRGGCVCAKFWALVCLAAGLPHLQRLQSSLSTQATTATPDSSIAVAIHAGSTRRFAPALNSIPLRRPRAAHHNKLSPSHPQVTEPLLQPGRVPESMPDSNTPPFPTPQDRKQEKRLPG